MDSETIGMIQQYLDDYIKEQILADYVVMWVDVKKDGFIESEKSAVVGQLYGGALRLLSNLNGYEEENINPVDLREFNKLFKSRLEGIENKIETILHENNSN